MIKKYTAQEIEARMISLGMAIPDFHIAGIRSQESIPDKFDDSIYQIDHHLLINGPFWCTTNPGKDYLIAPMNPKGTAVLVADKQYYNCFSLGLHKGKEALIQKRDLLVYRDNDKDIYAEELGEIVIAKPECRIDIHRANDSWTSIIIGKWSAGCQVIANPKEFELFLKACKGSAKGLFTYTLLKEW
jgi:hypothetical protein